MLLFKCYSWEVDVWVNPLENKKIRVSGQKANTNVPKGKYLISLKFWFTLLHLCFSSYSILADFIILIATILLSTGVCKLTETYIGDIGGLSGEESLCWPCVTEYLKFSLPGHCWWYCDYLYSSSVCRSQSRLRLPCARCCTNKEQETSPALKSLQREYTKGGRGSREATWLAKGHIAGQWQRWE